MYVIRIYMDFLSNIYLSKHYIQAFNVEDFGFEKLVYICNDMKHT